jgi:hypothetical protein
MEIITELIDMRSFSNLWYWIALAVLWSSVSHFVLGVPFDMLTRARRQGGQAEQDFEEMVRINVSRIQNIEGTAGYWLAGFTAFFLTALILLGFYYRIEFAQALVLLGGPLIFIGWLTISVAHRQYHTPETGEALRRRLTRVRIYIQIIGMLSIFVTALWGMYQNLSIGALGS